MRTGEEVAAGDWSTAVGVAVGDDVALEVGVEPGVEPDPGGEPGADVAVGADVEGADVTVGADVEGADVTVGADVEGSADVPVELGVELSTEGVVPGAEVSPTDGSPVSVGVDGPGDAGVCEGVNVSLTDGVGEGVGDVEVGGKEAEGGCADADPAVADVRIGAGALETAVPPDSGGTAERVPRGRRVWAAPADVGTPWLGTVETVGGVERARAVAEPCPGRPPPGAGGPVTPSAISRLTSAVLNGGSVRSVTCWPTRWTAVCATAVAAAIPLSHPPTSQARRRPTPVTWRAGG